MLNYQRVLSLLCSYPRFWLRCNTSPSDPPDHECHGSCNEAHSMLFVNNLAQNGNEARRSVPRLCQAWAEIKADMRGLKVGIRFIYGSFAENGNERSDRFCICFVHPSNSQ